MRAMKRLGLPSVMVLLSGCSAAITERPCPRVTEFPIGVQREAGRQLARMRAENPGSALERMVEAMGVDRAFNRAICR